MKSPNGSFATALIVVSCVFAGGRIQADDNTTSPAAMKAEAARLSAKFGERLRRSRYMESNCTPTTYPGWEGFPLEKCRYSVKNADGTSRTAEVIMLNAPVEKISEWVVNSCVDAKSSLSQEMTDKLFNNIIGQSGGQYPVAGIVYEDIIPQDGKNEIYCFRNGVTVEIAGVTHRGTEQPTEEQIQLSLHGQVTKVFKYARIQSTTPAQYKANRGTEDVGDNDNRTPAWLEVSRKLYQKAWNSPHNELMTAWARGSL